MNYETIELIKDGETATLCLKREKALNAMDVKMLQELEDVLKRVASTSEIKILFISGKGRAFSAGGDIKTMLSSKDNSNYQQIMETIKNIIVALYTMPAITISLINGIAAGLGLSFALACDIVMLEKNAHVAMNFIHIGLVPDGGGHYFLKKRLGEHKAKQLIWKGEKLTSEQAYTIGLVDELYEGDTAQQMTIVKKKLHAQPIQAMIATKLLYCKQSKQELLDTLQEETIKQFEMRLTKDHQEGVRAFLEKRKPIFNPY